jgi:hypothetical protein
VPEMGASPPACHGAHRHHTPVVVVEPRGDAQRKSMSSMSVSVPSETPRSSPGGPRGHPGPASSPSPGSAGGTTSARRGRSTTTARKQRVT